MAADLHIHILKDIDESDLSAFFSNTVGSKWFNPILNKGMDVFKKISDTPNIWVGEVSWLKAALTGSASYIPDTIQHVSNIIGEELPVIDDDLISKIETAMNLSNATSYSLSNANSVLSFLREHKGEKVFTVSW